MRSNPDSLPKRFIFAYVKDNFLALTFKLFKASMKKFLLLITAVAMFSACTQTAPPITPNKESILRTGRWILASGVVTLKNPNGKDTTMDYMQFVSACHKDDYIKFDSLGQAAIFPGSLRCSPADADSVSFNWRLLNNDNNIDILNVFNFYWVVRDSIVLPYYLDTIATSPSLVIDSVWVVRFDSAAVSGPVYYQGYNIYNADISNFSKSGFTLSFKAYSTYPDTTQWHEGGPPAYQNPIMRNDTLRYVLNYNNF